MGVTIDGLWTGYSIYVYWHNSELQVIRALSLNSTLYKSPQHQLSLLAIGCVLLSRSLATESNGGISSASSAQVLLLQPPVQNSYSTHSIIASPLLSLPCRAQISTANPQQTLSIVLSVKIKVEVTLRLTVCLQSVRLGAKPLHTHVQKFFSTEPLRS
jgi:hypothetical protein